MTHSRRALVNELSDFRVRVRAWAAPRSVHAGSFGMLRSEQHPPSPRSTGGSLTKSKEPIFNKEYVVVIVRRAFVPRH